MRVVNNRYEKNKEWQKITFIGRGVAGKCYLAVDSNTQARFVVKRVSDGISVCIHSLLNIM